MKKIIPFGFWPAAWGLRGDSREIARIEYEHDDDHEVRDRLIATIRWRGVEYEHALVDIDVRYGRTTALEATIRRARINLTGDELKIFLLGIDRDQGTITPREYAEKIAEVTLTGVELDAARVQIKYNHGEITADEAEKEIATLNNEPWVKVIGEQSEPGRPDTLGMEISYNELFITYLAEQGYLGGEDQIINDWFIELSKQIALEDEIVDLPAVVRTVEPDNGTIKYE